MDHFKLGCLSLLPPFLGFVCAYAFAANRREKGDKLCVFFIAVSFLASSLALVEVLRSKEIIDLRFFAWIQSELIRVEWGMKIDPLSASMMVIVGFVSLLVHIYSLAYMEEDENKILFFAYLSLFTFMMLLLVSAPNVLQLFCGWEGVGFCSYLLIGFWYEKETATKSAIEAFVVNRMGDICFVLAMGAIFYCFETLDFRELFEKVNSGNLPSQFYINAICTLLFIGAMGKSGQFGLHTWLPNAMEAPTPVSALLHAATMVTAGVFLMIRFSPLIDLSAFAKQIIMIVGTLTGIFAGSVAVAQNDIKKIIAYSTCSQLGMMFTACAAGAYSVAFFHLFTHAFFKSLLFLGAGAIIHAMSQEQNIKRMGGLRAYLPFAYVTMVIGALALTGIPFFAGYYSKDLIMEAVYQSSFLFYVLGVVLIFFTGLYSWRLIFLVFHGKNRSDEHVLSHIHPPGRAMRFPMAVLAICSTVMGFLGEKLFIKNLLGFKWLNVIVERVPSAPPEFVPILPLIFVIISFAFCYAAYVKTPKIAEYLRNKYKYAYMLLARKWFVDEFYEKGVAASCYKTGAFLYAAGDRGSIDRFGPNGFADSALKTGELARKPQTGYLNDYVALAVLGVACALGAYLLLRTRVDLTRDLRVFAGRV